jgi:hypothetical protein
VRATNVPGTERVLGAARRLGLDPIVHLSSLRASKLRFAPKTGVHRSESEF